MSAESVRDALERWANVAAKLGAGSDHHFLPGLTATGLRELESQYLIRLPEDVRAMWGWRNGVNPVAHAGLGQWFPQLSVALDWGALTLRIRKEGDAGEVWGRKREPDDNARWVTLRGGQTSSEIDVTDAARQDCRVLIQDPTSPLDSYPTLTLTEAIEGWILAVEIGYWYVEDGRWSRRLENYPSTRDRWRM